MQIASRWPAPPVTGAEWLSNKCPGSPVVGKKECLSQCEKEGRKGVCVCRWQRLFNKEGNV